MCRRTTKSRTKKHKKPPSSILEESWLNDGLNTELKKVMVDNGWSRGANSSTPIMKATNRSKDIVALRREYEGMWGRLLKFVLVLGHYHSSLLLSRETCPDPPPPPLQPRTICAFVDYMILPKGTPICDFRSDVQITDRKDNPVQSCGK
jgi:hypothetical protein